MALTNTTSTASPVPCTEPTSVVSVPVLLICSSSLSSPDTRTKLGRSIPRIWSVIRSLLRCSGRITKIPIQRRLLSFGPPWSPSPLSTVIPVSGGLVPC